jgi:hypothetical protein
MLALAIAALIGAPIAAAGVIVDGTVAFAVTPSPTPAPAAGTGSASIGVTIGSSGSGGSSGSPIANTGGSHHGGTGSTSPGTPGVPTKPRVPGSPTATANRLILNATAFRPGQSLVAKGTGFTPGEKVQFVLYPGATGVKSFVADSSGTVTATFELSQHTAIGFYIVEATGWQSKRVASANYTVVSAASASGWTLPWLIWVIGGFAVVIAMVLGCGIAFGWLPLRRPSLVPSGHAP